MWRLALVITAVCGCGRLGFDRLGAADGTDGGVIDAPTPDGAIGDPAGFWIATSGQRTGEAPRTRADLVNGIRSDMATSVMAIGP